MSSKKPVQCLCFEHTSNMIEQSGEEKDIIVTKNHRAANAPAYDEGNFDDDLENWMGKLPDDLCNMSLIYLAIPGTHNSGSYTINKHSKQGRDLKIPNFKITNKLIHQWCKTQNLNIIQQLKNGIRLIDIRAQKSEDAAHTFHTVHGLRGVTVRDLLNDVRTFARAHSTEVVFLLFQHFHEFSTNDHEALVQMIKTVFGDLVLMDNSINIQDLTLNALVKKSINVVVVYVTKELKQRYFYNEQHFWYPWAQETDPKKLINKLDTYTATRLRSKGYIMQFVLTPTANTIFNNLTISLQTYVTNCMYKSKAINWIASQGPGKFGVNFIWGDFVEKDDFKFIKMVIGLNRKLL